MFGDTQNIAGQWQRFMSGAFHEIAHKTPEIPVGINLQDEDGAMTYICAAQVTEFGKIPAASPRSRSRRRPISSSRMTITSQSSTRLMLRSGTTGFRKAARLLRKRRASSATTTPLIPAPAMAA